MRLVRLISLCFSLLLGLALHGEHLVGGEITYECTGNDNYQITLKVYRDCFSQGAPFDINPPIGIYTGDGLLVQVVYFSAPFITNLNTEINDECFQVSTSVCVEEGVYTGTVNLPPNNSGYYIVYERCCRNSTILNLNSPGTQGSTYVAFVPPQSDAICNSSPSWVNFPPIGICQGIPLDFDHSAIDPDGDELVYELCTPYQGGSTFTPAPDPPSGPPFQNVVWGFGYSTANQMDANPELAIDPLTGYLTGTPTQLGQYVIGICVKEYRNGVLLSEVRRDFQFNVTNCPNLNNAAIASQAANTDCLGLTVDFENLSSNATNYLWFFGDGNTSTAFEPTYTYSDPGSYEVILISNPGDICADTATVLYSVAEPIPPDIGPATFICAPDPLYNLTLLNGMGEIESANWDFGGGIGDNNQINPTEVYFEPGNSFSISVDVVDEYGCESSGSTNLTVPPEPVAIIGNNNVPCSGFDITFINSSENAASYQWDFGLNGDLDQSFEASPTFNYPGAGVYTAQLIASASSSCPDTAYLDIEVTPNIYANFDPPGGQCFEGNAFEYVALGTFTSNATLTWTFENANISGFIGQNPPVVNYNTYGQQNVILTAFEDGCETVFNAISNVVPNPEADFTVQGDGCAPMVAWFSNESFGGSNPKYKWNFGDGNYSIGQSPVNVYEYPGLYGVGLWVISNGDCIDSSYVYYPDLVEVNPSPSAAFEIDRYQIDIVDPSINVTTFIEDPFWTCQFWLSDSTYYDACSFYHEFQTPGTYEVQIQVTNEYDCKAFATQEVVVSGSLFWAPNAVTMNGDGINDFFNPVVLGAHNYEIVIYDRWGQVLYESVDPNVPWIPDYAHPGVYVYRALVTDNTAKIHEYFGHFTIIR